MTPVPRTEPAEARRKLEQGSAVLVCAYDDEDRCRAMRIEGAMTLGEFRTSPPRDKEVIFYCA